MKSSKQVHKLSKEEISEIEKIIKTHSIPRVRIRVIMIRLSNEGHTATQISKVLGCGGQTALNQMARYEKEGIWGLEDKARSGARPKAGPEYIKKLKEAVNDDPRALGYRFSRHLSKLISVKTCILS